MEQLNFEQMEAIKRTILGRLIWSVPVTPFKMNLDKVVLLQALRELKDENKVTYSITRGNSVFAGEPEKIRATIKGRQEAEENNYSIDLQTNLERL